MGRLLPLACLALAASASLAQTITPTVTVIDDEYVWGYRRGVKQPGGQWRLGQGVHNISRETEPRLGSPDYLVWIDGDFATIRELGHDDAAVENPGGQAAFDGEGKIVYVLGGRASVLPFDMIRVDPTDWTVETLLDDFITYAASTTACVSVFGDEVLHLYRYAGSSHVEQVAVRAQRWDIAGEASMIGDEIELARGEVHPVLGDIGIEQLWTKLDPRGMVAATWQYWTTQDRIFGACPFVWTDDQGQTWRDVSGESLTLPLRYSDMTPTLLPYDHLATGENSNWLPRDLGWAPDGSPWMTTVDGSGFALFLRWDGSAWQSQVLAGPVLSGARPFACGTVRDYLVFVYAEASAPGDLYAIVSREGVVWSDPVLVDSVTGFGGPGIDEFGMVSFFQPVRYLDNAARFLLTYSDGTFMQQRSYQNAVRLVSIQVGSRADFNGDGSVDSRDFIDFLNTWAAEGWRADLDDNGAIDTRDFITFLNAWSE